jgi:hypothetical protein
MTTVLQEGSGDSDEDLLYEFVSNSDGIPMELLPRLRRRTAMEESVASAAAAVLAPALIVGHFVVVEMKRGEGGVLHSFSKSFNWRRCQIFG